MAGMQQICYNGSMGHEEDIAAKIAEQLLSEGISPERVPTLLAEVQRIMRERSVVRDSVQQVLTQPTESHESSEAELVEEIAKRGRSI
jgi:hypothetical protein